MRKYMKMTILGVVFCGLWLIAWQASALGPVDGFDLAPADLERVTVGALAPDFSLEDEAGNVVTLSRFRGQKNVVLVFYRGHW